MSDESNIQKVLKVMVAGESYHADELAAMTAVPQLTISRIIITLIIQHKIRTVGVGAMPRNRLYAKVVPTKELLRMPDHVFAHSRMH